MDVLRFTSLVLVSHTKNKYAVGFFSSDNFGEFSIRLFVTQSTGSLTIQSTFTGLLLDIKLEFFLSSYTLGLLGKLNVLTLFSLLFILM